MENRVGDKIPTQEQVETIRTKLEEVLADVSPFGRDLTGDQRQGTTKFRPGGERIVELVCDAAARRNVSLPGISVEGIKADLTLAQRTRPLIKDAQAVADRLGDTALEAESECWWATLALYTALVRLADTDPALKNELAPAVDFFAKGRRKPAAK